MKNKKNFNFITIIISVIIMYLNKCEMYAYTRNINK